MHRFRFLFLLLASGTLAACATTPGVRSEHTHSVEENNELAEAFGYIPEHQHPAAPGAADGGAGETLFRPSVGERFRVRLEPTDGAFMTGMNSAYLLLEDPDGARLAGATVEVIPWMPLHGHGINARPTVTDQGSGAYRVENLDLPMAGMWELRMTIRRGDVEDEFRYGPFTTAPAETTGREYIKARSPAGYDVTLGVESTPVVLQPEVSVDAQGRPVKHFRLRVEEVAVDLYPGKRVVAWAFNGVLPGPEMRVQEGDVVRITLTNNVRDSHHTVHVHGLRKTVPNDGVPYLGQAPTEYGEQYTYEFMAEPSGTSWYHCHVDSAHHVDMGMYGAFIVEPAEPEVAFDREYTMVLDEWPSGHEHTAGAPGQMDHPGHQVVMRHSGPPQHGGAAAQPAKRDWYPETYNRYQPTYDTFLINGRSFPYTTPLDVKTGERVKVRIINAGYEPHYIHLHAHKFLVTHRDGRPVAQPQAMDTVHVGPGQRADILITADNPGIWPLHCHRIPHVANDHIYPGGMLTFLRYVDWAGAQAVEPKGADDGFFDDLE